MFLHETLSPRQNSNINTVLNPTQISIINTLAPTESKDVNIFDFVMRTLLLNNIVKEEFVSGGGPPNGIQIPRDHSRLAAFTRRLIGNMDGYFDDNRSHFEVALAAGPGELSVALLNAPVDEKGVGCTVGDMREIIESVINSPSIYTTQNERDILNSSLSKFFEDYVSIISVIEKTPATVTGTEAQNLRDRVNRCVAEVLFDVEFASLANHPNYTNAKARMIASWQATQYIDDIDDLPEDIKRPGVSMFLAFAREFNEYDALTKALETKIGGETGDYQEFRREIYQVAPLTYRKLWELQQEKLAVVRNKTFVGLQGIPKLWD